MVYCDWNRWSDDGFTFLGSDVSISWVYLLSQMPLWQPLYPHWLNIRYCRCFFWDRCIRNLLFFKLADTFQPTHHVQLHLHLAFSKTWGCFLCKFYIYILPFLKLEDVPHWNYASSPCPFYNLRIHLIKILHLQFQKTYYHRYWGKLSSTVNKRDV